MKTSLNRKVFAGLFILFVFGCGSKPKPKPDEALARKAFNDLDKEMETPQTEKDITGVTKETTDEIKTILDEPDVIAMEKYQTGKPGWIKIDGERHYDGSIAPDDARQKLLGILRNEAVNKKVGTTVEITTLLTDLMVAENDETFEQTAWSGFFRSTVSGVITDENYEDSMVPDSDGYNMKMTLNAFVEPVTGQRDPGFYMDTRLNTNMLKEGQKLVISVKPSKDAYLYIINLMADNNAMLMYPNDYMKDNFIPAGSELIVPDPEMQKFISFRVGTMPGQPITSESIYIICTKEKVPKIDNLPKIGLSLQTFSGKSKNFVELQRWLTGIPLDQRTEKALIYHVSK